MKKVKLMIVVGTRPEIIRLSEVIKACDRYFDVVLVHTGQNYDRQLNEVFFENFKLKDPDHYLDAPGKHLGETVGNIISKSYELIQSVKPDALLVLGDTNSCLSAYSAKRCKVPIFHMEAGNRCFDFNVPEEINRRVVDHISDINLAYTENARQYLIREGFTEDTVYVTGSPMTEVLAKNAVSIDASSILNQLRLQPGKYFVVSMHREENVDTPARFAVLITALDQVAETYQYPLIFSTHPRTRKRLEIEGVKLHELIRNLEPLDFFDYNKLQKEAFCVLSDSGTVPEEAAILNFPGVSLRNSTERPEALDGGAIVLGGNTADNVIGAIEIAVGTYDAGRENPVKDYRDLRVSEKVVKIIHSYFDIVNERVWKK